ncbi:MAG TPA: hypothetical protein DCF33_04120 [Saprospirales bacterium]|nr:hypothetical protein [Saprospirales bacterium]
MNIKDLLFYGFLTWLIPYGISFLFFKPGGELAVSYDLFKSIMIVVASITGSYCLFRYFKSVNQNYVKEGLVVGVAWFALNIVLDVVALLPIMKVSFGEYFISIGLRYLIIPVFAYTVGAMLNQKRHGIQ